MTGCDGHYHANRFPTNSHLPWFFQNVFGHSVFVYFFEVYLTGNTMQINFQQIAQFPPFWHNTATLHFFWSQFFLPKSFIQIRWALTRWSFWVCGRSRCWFFSLFPLDRVYWAISVKHLEVWYGRLTIINVCTLGPVVASSEVSHTHCSFKM